MTGPSISPDRLPDVWLFDLDNTLYPANSRLFDQINVRMTRFIANFLGVDDEAAGLVRRTLWHKHGTTLNGLMREHALEPAAFLDYVHDIDHSVLAVDSEFDATLARLPGRKIIFTNGSLTHAERVLARLGLAHHFEGIYDIIASGYVPKPEAATYAQVVQRFGIDPARAAMVEDSPHNLPPAAAMGMMTVWVPPTPDHDPGESAPHIHHVAHNLPQWLSMLVPEASRPD